MAAKIFSVAQQKGGAGKTTLAAHLAIAWVRQGRRVALVDIDPQASLSFWYEQRQKTLNGEGDDLTFRTLSGWRTTGEVEKLKSQHDIVVIDCPPHAETDAKIAVRAADTVLIPVQPSPLDFWATKPTLELASKEKKPVILVLNRVPHRTNLAATMITRLGEYKVKVAHTPLGSRVAFAESMGSGRTALETQPSGTAAEEIYALSKELLKKAIS